MPSDQLLMKPLKTMISNDIQDKCEGEQNYRWQKQGLKIKGKYEQRLPRNYL